MTDQIIGVLEFLRFIHTYANGRPYVAWATLASKGNSAREPTSEDDGRHIRALDRILTAYIIETSECHSAIEAAPGDRSYRRRRRRLQASERQTATRTLSRSRAGPRENAHAWSISFRHEPTTDAYVLDAWPKILLTCRCDR